MAGIGCLSPLLFRTEGPLNEPLNTGASATGRIEPAGWMVRGDNVGEHSNALSMNHRIKVSPTFFLAVSRSLVAGDLEWAWAKEHQLQHCTTEVVPPPDIDYPYAILPRLASFATAQRWASDFLLEWSRTSELRIKLEWITTLGHIQRSNGIHLDPSCILE